MRRKAASLLLVAMMMSVAVPVHASEQATVTIQESQGENREVDQVQSSETTESKPSTSQITTTAERKEEVTSTHKKKQNKKKDKKKEKKVKKLKKTKKKELSNDFLYHDMEEKVKLKTGTKVRINRKSENKGKIEIEYYSQDDLEKILAYFK